MREALPTTIGPFRVEAVLGRGGCGVVYRARHLAGWPAAVKAARAGDGAARLALRREIEALRRLVHPGVIRLRGHDADADTPYYAMELVEGPTLRAWARQLWPADADEPPPTYAVAVARAMAQMCDTLAYVHAEGLIHRDLQPDNILLRDERAPVLVDFGLATHTPGVRPGEILVNELEAAGQLP